MRVSRRSLFGLLFVLSGATGLVYELLWIRALHQFFGSTIHSVTTVVAAYMGGLGLGAYLIGRRADRHARPAALYGALEVGIGVFGILSPWLLAGVGAAYLALAAWLRPGLWLATGIKFAAAFAVLLVPTVMMGGTLPALTRAFAGDRPERLRRELALFYGLNTVGAVAGCLLAGIVLMELVGLRASLVAAGLLSIALGGAALALARQQRVEPAPPAAPVVPPVLPVGPAAPSTARRLAFALLVATAFASLLYEIAWTRVLVLVIGSSTYAFTIILGAFLLGLGFGSLLVSGAGRPARDLLMRAAMVQASVAVLASLLFPFFRWLPVYVVGTLQVGFLSPGTLLLLHALAVALVVVPPALGMGMTFPLLAELASSRTERAGTGIEVGRAYLANTVGSIGGAVVTGFLLIHLVGSERTLQLGVAINVTAAALLALKAGPPRVATPFLLGALALAVGLATPSWSRRLLDSGAVVYGRQPMDRERLDDFLRGAGAEQLAFTEGWNAAVSVWRNGSATWMKLNGKVDASSLSDMNAQVMMGLLPALLHPSPERVFVVGLGSGATVRVLADVPGVRRLDVAEIERAVVGAAPFFRDVNGDVLKDPRVNLVEDDARSVLQLAGERYDLVVSEPPNPWMAGVSALFTRDYFRIVRAHLAPGGVFAQWVQTYGVPVGLVASVVAGLRSVFRGVEVWYADPTDLVIVASDAPIRWQRGRAAALLDPGTATGRAARDWLRVERPSHLLGYYLLGERGVSALAAQATFAHTDDRPVLEFAAARSLLEARSVTQTFDSLVALRVSVSDTLPRLGDWVLEPGDWEAAYARVLPPENPFALAYAHQAREREPRNPARRGELGSLLFARREFRAAMAELGPSLVALPDDGDRLLEAGLSTVALGDLEGGIALLERARIAGGDSVYAASVLAQILAQRGETQRAAALAVRAIRGLRPTIAHPFPAALDGALRALAERAPPEVVLPVLELARDSRPSWELPYLLAVNVSARLRSEGGCAQGAVVALELRRFGWREREIAALLGPCALARAQGRHSSPSDQRDAVGP